MVVLNPKGRAMVKRALVYRPYSGASRGRGWQIRRSTKTGMFSKAGKPIGPAVNPHLKGVFNETAPVAKLASGFYLNTILQNVTGWNDGAKGFAAGLGGAVLMGLIPGWGRELRQGALVQLGVKYSLPYVSRVFERGSQPTQQQQQVSATNVSAAQQLVAPAAQGVGEVSEPNVIVDEIS